VGVAYSTTEHPFPLEMHLLIQLAKSLNNPKLKLLYVPLIGSRPSHKRKSSGTRASFNASYNLNYIFVIPQLTPSGFPKEKP